MRGILIKATPFVFFALALVAGRIGFEALAERRDARPGLEGEMRTTFIDSGMATCVAGQKASHENAGIDDTLIQVYCACYMKALADQVSAADLKLALAGSIDAYMAAIYSKTDSSSKTCVAEVRAKDA